MNSKPWTDTTLIVNYTLTSRDGSSLQATTVGIGRDNSDKGANKAMSQAFKYLLLQVLCISDAKDDADGSTFEADAHYEEPEHPLADRVRAVMAEIGTLDADGKSAMKEWKGEHSLAGPALLADEGWLLMVESWIDERKATQ